MPIKVLTNKYLHIRMNRYVFLAYTIPIILKTGGEINANI